MHVKRIFNEPSASYFLFGPRGTGKSTLMTDLHPKALIINLLLPSYRRLLMTNPEGLLELVRAEPNGQTIILDEIQRVPELLSLVHLLIEEKKGWKFILTGSSARKLKKEGIDLLGGRALQRNLHPFMACELGENFNVEDALKYGLIPLRFGQTDPSETLSAYVSLYLEEEVKAEGLVRNIEPFARFLEILSFSHGSILNLSNIARECAIKRSTASHWLTIVEDLLIGFQIPVFKQRAERILSSQSKYYYFDTGVYQTLRPRYLLDTTSEVDGIALEGLIAQHLYAWIDYSRAKHELAYWRTKSGLEVDFIVHGESGIWAIEVKSSQYIQPKDLRGLSNFKEDYPEAKTILLYRGKDRLMKENILCLPCDAFLKSLKPNEILCEFPS